MTNQFTFEALGTKWWIELFENISEQRLTALKKDCEAFIMTFEDSYSRFKPNSCISMINRERVLKDPSQELIDLLTFGKQKYLETNALFNILTGHIQEAKGYDAEYSFMMADTIPLPGNPVTDLAIDESKITLSGYSKIDLGGYGKGYLIDLVVDRLKKEHGLNYFLINGGGDIYATSDNGEPVEIQIEHPTEPEKFIGATTLLNGAFAASSSHKRRWKTKQGEQNHIVGEAGDSSYVKAKTAKEADVLATVKLLTK